MSQRFKRRLGEKVNELRRQNKSLNNAIIRKDREIERLNNKLELALLDRCDCDLTEILEA